jgi:hypothetical protein
MAKATAPELPALDRARTELAAGQFPAPEDCLNDLDPITGLFYVEQWAYDLLRIWAANAGAAEDEDAAAQEQIAQALEAIGMACGNLDAACALMGILPPEAADK